MKYFFSFILFFSSWNVIADEVLPASCKPIVIDGESAILAVTQPSLIVLHNLSETDLWITHPVSEPGASAGWSSRLQAGNWSALALQEKSFEISCIESKPGHEQQIPCKDVLAACGWMNVTMPSQEVSGPYWAGEDMSLSALIAYLGRRGFVLPTPSQ